MLELDPIKTKEIQNFRMIGYSYLEISKKFNISKATAYKYCKKILINGNGLKRLEDKINKNQRLFVEKFAVLKAIKEPKNIDLVLIRIFSHCLFDGCVKDDGVVYTNASKQLIKEFREDMKNVFGISPDVVVKREKITPYWILCYNYTLVSNFLKRFSKSYSTSSNEVNIPNFLFKEDSKFIIEYLRCFWDDEGAVKFNGDVTAKTKSLKIANQLVKLHYKVGVKVRNYYDSKNVAYELYILRGENLKKFQKIIGFKYGIVCRGKFKGLSKSDALSLVIK